MFIYVNVIFVLLKRERAGPVDCIVADAIDPMVKITKEFKLRRSQRIYKSEREWG